jgi:hypothetical protein
MIARVIQTATKAAFMGSQNAKGVLAQQSRALSNYHPVGMVRAPTAPIPMLYLMCVFL